MRADGIYGSGQKDGLNAGGLEGRNRCGLRLFEMIAGRGAQLGSKVTRPERAELVGVHSQAEPVGFRRGQDTPCLVEIEDLALAEDVAELGEILRGYARDHLIDDQVDVVIGPSGKFFGDLMGAEKCRHDAEWRRFGGAAYDTQNLDLVLDCESVTRFCFDGGRSTLEKPLSVPRARSTSWSSVAVRVLRTVERMPPP